MQWLEGWGKSHMAGGHINGQAGNIICLHAKGNEAKESSNVRYRKTVMNISCWSTASRI
jgi:hypothetical protein